MPPVLRLPLRWALSPVSQPQLFGIRRKTLRLCAVILPNHQMPSEFLLSSNKLHLRNSSSKNLCQEKNFPSFKIHWMPVSSWTQVWVILLAGASEQKVLEILRDSEPFNVGLSREDLKAWCTRRKLKMLQVREVAVDPERSPRIPFKLGFLGRTSVTAYRVSGPRSWPWSNGRRCFWPFVWSIKACQGIGGRNSPPAALKENLGQTWMHQLWLV